MSITRSDALRIFRRRYRTPNLLIHDVGERDDDGCYPLVPNSWFIRFSIDDAPLIRPSRLVCISKSEGEIVYDGSAGDEG